MQLFIRGVIAALVVLGVLMMSQTRSLGQGQPSTADTDVFFCTKLEHIVEIIELLQARKQSLYQTRFFQLVRPRKPRRPECFYEPPGKVGLYKVLARYKEVPHGDNIWVEMVIVQETTPKKPTRYLLLERTITSREFST